VKAELSEDTEIRFGRVADDGDETVDWYPVDHAHRDGAGALVDVLERLGIQVPVPTARFAGRATLAAWLAWARESRKSSGLAPLRWRPDVVDGSAEIPPGTHTNGGPIAWREFSDSLVDAMRRHAARIGVSVNSLLTWAVARSLVPAFQIIEPGEPIHVGLATNIRNPGNSNRSNHSPQFSAIVGPCDGPNEVHVAIRGTLRSGAMIATDRYFRLAARVPDRVLRWRLSRDFSGEKLRRPMSHALFSNMGRWDIAGENSAWVFLPCALIQQPLAIGAISVNGRFVLAIKLHHSLGVASPRIEAALSDFAEFLALTCSPSGNAETSTPGPRMTIRRETPRAASVGET
jgi:hypothetical protein